MCSCQILSQFSSGSDEVLYGRATPVGTPTEPWEQDEAFLPSGTGGLGMKDIPVTVMRGSWCVFVCWV